jgi:hypothetical protein
MPPLLILLFLYVPLGGLLMGLAVAFGVVLMRTPADVEAKPAKRPGRRIDMTEYPGKRRVSRVGR